jgi:hypothetical protein
MRSKWKGGLKRDLFVPERWGGEEILEFEL